MWRKFIISTPGKRIFLKGRERWGGDVNEWRYFLASQVEGQSKTLFIDDI